MATVRLGGRNAAEVVSTAIAAGEDCAVAWGVTGASPDGWTTIAASVDALQRHVKFGQSRIAGKRSREVVYGPVSMVHDHWYPGR